MRFAATLLILSALACAQDPEPQTQGPYLDDKPLQSMDGTELAAPTASGVIFWEERFDEPPTPCTVCVQLGATEQSPTGQRCAVWETRRGCDKDASTVYFSLDSLLTTHARLLSELRYRD